MNEICIQAMVKLCVSSVKEGDELLNCNVNISMMQKKDAIGGVSEINEEPKSIVTYQRQKRQKMTQPSDIPTNDLLISDEDTCLDLPVEIESAKLEPFCHEVASEKNVTAEDEFSVENVSTSKLVEKDSDCDMGFCGTLSNIDNTEKLNENDFDADKLASTQPKSSAGCAIVPETTENDKFPIPVSGDANCNNVPLPLNDMEPGFPESSDVKFTNESSSDAHNANNLLEEDLDEVGTTVHNFELGKTLLEKENISILPRVSSGEASCGNVSMKKLDNIGAISSQMINECVNMEIDRAFTGCTGKKLLVLDVNGLLVDISPYVPYDYDPDDIILRKAVFKRPYCDDFLKFCFEKFNVGVWTSRTRRNMEPILDFLLGNDKSRLLFCWDQSHCTDTGFTTVEKRNKPLLLKKLKKLWDKCEPDLPWEMGVYNESNTLLLDDTPSKSLANPQYSAVFPHTYQFRDVGDNSLGPGGDLRVYLEGLAMVENVQEYVKQNPFGQRPITEKNLSWGYYLKVIEVSSTPPRQTEQDDF